MISPSVLKSIKAESYKFKKQINKEPDNHRVLVVGDLHLPFTHENYLGFCKRIYKQYKCNKVVFIGDIIDNHYTSYHETEISCDQYFCGEHLKYIEVDGLSSRLCKVCYKALLDDVNYLYDKEEDIFTYQGGK